MDVYFLTDFLKYMPRWFCLLLVWFLAIVYMCVYTCIYVNIRIDCELVVNKIFLSLSLLLYYLKLENNAHLLTAYTYWKAINFKKCIEVLRTLLMIQNCNSAHFLLYFLLYMDGYCLILCNKFNFQGKKIQ